MKRTDSFVYAIKMRTLTSPRYGSGKELQCRHKERGTARGVRRGPERKQSEHGQQTETIMKGGGGGWWTVSEEEREREREERGQMGQERSCGPIGQELKTKRSPALESGEREMKLSVAPHKPPPHPSLTPATAV